MYQTSLLVSNRRTSFVYEITDTCFGIVQTYIVPKVNIPMTYGQLEVCVVAQEYYRRNRNVPRNLAYYYLYKRASDTWNSTVARAYRSFMDDRQSINAFLPHISYMNRVAPLVKIYLCEPEEKIRNRLTRKK